MGNADWGSGFATGLAAGGGTKVVTQSVAVEVPVEDKRISRKYEEVIMRREARGEAQSAVRKALQAELRRLDPTNPLISPSIEFRQIEMGPKAKEIYEAEYNRMMNGGFIEDSSCRDMTPHHAADWKAERVDPFKKQYNAEYHFAAQKVSVIGQLLGKKPDFPDFEKWMADKGLDHETAQPLKADGDGVKVS